MDSQTPPSAWVQRFAPLVQPGGRVLDLAAGAGRHTRLLLDMGYAVDAVDREVAELLPLQGANCRVHQIDLETSAGWSLDDEYDGIVVTNYLHRMLLPAIVGALAPGGVLIYETFARGNERFGHPSNPAFLLRPGELLQAFASLTIVAFEQGEVAAPRASVIQRIAAVAGGVGRLPDGAIPDKAPPPA